MGSWRPCRQLWEGRKGRCEQGPYSAVLHLAGDARAAARGLHQRSLGRGTNREVLRPVFTKNGLKPDRLLKRGFWASKEGRHRGSTTRTYLYYRCLTETAQESRCCRDTDAVLSAYHEGGKQLKHQNNVTSLITFKPQRTGGLLPTNCGGSGSGGVRMELGEIMLGTMWHVILIFNSRDQEPTTQALSHTSRTEGNVNTAGRLAARETSRTARCCKRGWALL